MSKPRSWSPAHVAACVHDWLLDRCLRCYHTRTLPDALSHISLKSDVAAERNTPGCNVPVEPDPDGWIGREVTQILSASSTPTLTMPPASDRIGTSPAYHILVEPDPFDVIAEVHWPEHADQGDEDDGAISPTWELEDDEAGGLIRVVCPENHVTEPARQHWIHDPRCYAVATSERTGGMHNCLKRAEPVSGQTLHTYRCERGHETLVSNGVQQERCYQMIPPRDIGGWGSMCSRPLRRVWVTD